jgi:hypothetical protein
LGGPGGPGAPAASGAPNRSDISDPSDTSDRYLWALVHAYLAPLAETVRDADEPTWYARFVQRFAIGGYVVDPPLDPSLVAGMRRGLDLIDAELTHRRLPPPLRAERMRLMTLLITAALADAERRLAEGEPLPLPFDELTDNLTASAVGLLTAPNPTTA